LPKDRFKRQDLLLKKVNPETRCLKNWTRDFTLIPTICRDCWKSPWAGDEIAVEVRLQAILSPVRGFGI